MPFVYRDHLTRSKPTQLEAGSWKLEAGSWKLEAGSWKPGLEAGSWKLEAGSWKLEAVKLEAGSWKLESYLFPRSARSPGFSPGHIAPTLGS
ncbi:hypothetical protein PSGK_20350 [Pseudomonas solani]|uniref:hypothetical protein n=1 Tax=Pseudomonas solani TaxID=2731552 RepID=UPI0035BE326F